MVLKTGKDFLTPALIIWISSNPSSESNRLLLVLDMILFSFRSIVQNGFTAHLLLLLFSLFIIAAVIIPRKRLGN